MKWMAAADALECQPQALYGPMLVNGFLPVFRTGGEKSTAVANEGADSGLIGLNQKNNHYSHETIL